MIHFNSYLFTVLVFTDCIIASLQMIIDDEYVSSLSSSSDFNRLLHYQDIDSVCSVDGTWDPYPTCQVTLTLLSDQLSLQL